MQKATDSSLKNVQNAIVWEHDELKEQLLTVSTELVAYKKKEDKQYFN